MGEDVQVLTEPNYSGLNVGFPSARNAGTGDASKLQIYLSLSWLGASAQNEALRS